VAVPVQNIYYLLCYAWDRLEARGLVDAASVPGNRVENLLGAVLDAAVGHLIRRGLDRGYRAIVEEERAIRGKLLMGPTVKRDLLPLGRAVCEYDELTLDVPHNRVLKAAMRALLSVPTLDRAIAGRLRRHAERFRDVSDLPALDAAAFRAVQLHRNTAGYAFALHVSELVARSFIADQRTGQRRFHPFTQSDQEMGALFEAFVRNFLRREQDAFQVSADHVPWHVEPLPASDLDWLPRMKTDVTLASPTRRIVLETKCYARPYQDRFETRRKLISSNLYQILTYVSQLSRTPGPEPIGVLLYAQVGEQQRLDYRLGGLTVLVRTLDLLQPWQAIHRDLLHLAQELDGWAA
jgi:5-methylcytosine-specific restriction enzyme subunit McrC